jgi:geranylgeranyl pyrophosphate synthase
MDVTLADFYQEFTRFVQTFQAEDERMSLLIKDALGDGMRMRPFLAFIGFNIFSDKLSMHQNLCRLCLSIELIHKASVILDDYIDDDKLRRGKPTFFMSYGKEIATIFPYYFISQSIHFLFMIVNSPEISENVRVKILSLYDEILSSMSKGSVLEITRNGFEFCRADSIEMNTLQSSILLKNALMLGLTLSGVINNEYVQLLEKIGLNIGFIFQTINDLNPFVETTTEMVVKGRKYTDLIMKRNNLVIATLMEKLGQDEKRFFVDELQKSPLNDEIITLFLKRLETTNTIHEVKLFIEKKFQETLDRIALLPNTPAVKLLRDSLNAVSSNTFWIASSVHDLNIPVTN